MDTTIIDNKQLITDLETTFATRVSNGDVGEAVNGFYAEGARFIAPNAQPAIGLEAVTNAIQGFVDNGLENLDLTTLEVSGDGNTVWNRGSYKLTLNTPDGTVTDTGSFVTIFERQDGELRCVVDIFNSDLPE